LFFFNFHWVCTFPVTVDSCNARATHWFLVDAAEMIIDDV